MCVCVCVCVYGHFCITCVWMHIAYQCVFGVSLLLPAAMLNVLQYDESDNIYMHVGEKSILFGACCGDCDNGWRKGCQ